VCGQPALRQRIEELLKAQPYLGESWRTRRHRHARRPGNNPIDPPARREAGTRIGRYKLLQKIGEGGCGVVYMAEQEEPVAGGVALR